MDDANGLTYARLGDVGVLLMGNSPPGETYNDRGDGLPLINGPAEYGPRHPRPVKWTTAPSRICKPGDILVCVRGNTTGRLCVADAEYCIGRGVAALRGKEKTYLTPFLEFVLRFHQDEILEKATGGGSTFPNINKPQLEELEVPLPPIDEQQTIAYILRTVQRASEATEKVIAAARQLKQSLMRHLFTYGPVPVEQADQVTLKETEIGPIPEHWQLVRLGDLGRIGNGSTPKRTNDGYWNGGTIPWLTSAKVYDRIVRQADEYVTELARDECHLPLVKKGSVVVAITGQGKTLGNAALLGLDTCVSQHLAYIQPTNGSIVGEFLLSFLHQRYWHFRQVSNAGGSTKGALTCGFLKGYPCPLPPLDEQKNIAQMIEAVERKLAAELSKVSGLDAFFRSSLHHLLTGKVRVNELEFPAMKEDSP